MYYLPQHPQLRARIRLAIALTCVVVLGSGCQYFEPKNTITSSSGNEINVNDRTVKQYLSEWSDSKDSIERLADMEGDLTFLLSEVSKLSDIGRTPGLQASPKLAAPAAAALTPPLVMAPPAPVIAPAPAPIIPVATAPTPIIAPVVAAPVHTAPANAAPVNAAPPVYAAALTTAPAPQVQATLTPSGSHRLTPAGAVAAPVQVHGGTSTYITEVPAVVNNFNFDDALCSENYQNFYKKSLAFVSFPRTPNTNVQLGRLQQVEQHLPMLIGANLRNRHNMITPIQLRGALRGIGENEQLAASQAQELAKQHRVQYLVSGEVDDMSMTFASRFDEPNYYTRFVNGVHNFFNVDTRLDKRTRVFSFRLDVRDGVTGHLVFSHNYRTFGKWKVAPNVAIGFGSPHFWQTEYGVQVQHLVAKASDELAASLNCQPYVARVDTSPAQEMVVVQSGSNNGMRSGDSLPLFKVVYQSIPGEYQQYSTRLIEQKGRVYLTEIYPSHSVGRVMHQPILQGQYVIKSN